jgi:hypothetical protein
MIVPGTEVLICSILIAERLHDENRRGKLESARCEDHRGGSAPSSTPLLLPSSTGAGPAPARLTPPGSAVDPLHHTSTLTPPAALPPGDLVTPDAERLFYSVSYSHRNYPIQTRCSCGIWIIECLCNDYMQKKSDCSSGQGEKGLLGY